jgi:hypothetical protein
LVLEEVGPHHSLSMYMYMAVVLLKKSKSVHLRRKLDEVAEKSPQQQL